MNEGFSIYFTGLSGSGKSTLARETAVYLEEQGILVQILDGDILRKNIGNMFGYSREERMKMSKVVRLIANLLNRNGISVIIAVIGPYQEMREINRREIKNYYEIYLNCSLETCVKRDTKGLYEQALQGDLKHMVGVDDVYEIPKSYDLEIDTDHKSIAGAADEIKRFIDSKILARV